MSWTAPLWRRLSGRNVRPLAALRGEGFVALDLETTGLDARRDVAVSLAAIPFVAGAAGEGLVTLVDPGRPIPVASTTIHGIDDAMVAGAPPIEQVLPRLVRLWEGRPVVGHGVTFDLTILSRAGGRRWAGPPAGTLDTMALAAALHPEWAEWSLEGVAARLGLEIVGRHTARGDALAAGQVLLALLPDAEAYGCRTLPELAWLQDTGTGRLG